MAEFDFGGAKVLVVGGAGFVGSNLVRLLLNSNVGSVLIVDNLLSSDMANVPLDDRVTLIPRSITDDAVLAALPQDLEYVFHLACFHGNQSSIADPLRDHDNNTLTSLKLFDRLKDFTGLKAVVYAAAGCAVAEKTFGEAAATKEDAPISAYHDSPYSISKLVGEFYGNFYFRQHGLPFVKARFQNVYGPGEILGAGDYRGTVNTVWRNVTPTFIFRALHGDQLRLDNGGDASRDFIFVEDMARGLAACAVRGAPGEVYNLASGVETTILELAQKVNALAGNDTPFDLAPRRAWDTSGKRFGDPSKARDQLGFKATVGIDDGLSRTVAWTRDNLDLIKRCMAQHRKFVPEVGRYLD
jgi:UDP-glucose 4-epimerase